MRQFFKVCAQFHKMFETVGNKLECFSLTNTFTFLDKDKISNIENGFRHQILDLDECLVYDNDSR
jgi:hypothetical protein